MSTVKVTVTVPECAGDAIQVVVEAESGSTVTDVIQQRNAQVSTGQQVSKKSAIAVNAEPVAGDTVVRDGDEMVVTPRSVSNG